MLLLFAYYCFLFKSNLCTAACLALAMLPAGFLLLAPRHPPWRGLSWWQVAITETPHKHLWGSIVCLFFSFLSSLPQAKHATCSFDITQSISHLMAFPFLELGRVGVCMGQDFCDFQVKCVLWHTRVNFCLSAFSGSSWGTTPLFRSCKHMACSNLAIAQGLNVSCGVLTIQGTQGAQNELLDTYKI